MTEEGSQQSFARYLAAQEAVAAYGLMEEFEDEPSFETAPTSAAWGMLLKVVGPPEEVNIQAVSAGYSRVSAAVVGTRKSYVLNIPRVSARFGETGIEATTFVTSRALATQFTIGHGDSMATQQPPFADEQSVEEIIRRVQMTLPLTYRARLVSRLRELQKAVQEEESDGRGISAGSLQHFIQFLEAHRALRCPAISVTPDRNIYASWKSGSDRVFSVHFLPEGQVRFVIFYPNDSHPGQTVRLSGTATVDVIIGIAAPHGVLDWAQNERSGHTRF